MLARKQKIEILRELQKGGVNREKLLHQMQLQVISVESPDEEEDYEFEAWVEDMGFIYDKKRGELLVPYKLTAEQEAKLFKDGRSTTEELLEYLESTNTKTHK